MELFYKHFYDVSYYELRITVLLYYSCPLKIYITLYYVYIAIQECYLNFFEVIATAHFDYNVGILYLQTKISVYLSLVLNLLNSSKYDV